MVTAILPLKVENVNVHRRGKRLIGPVNLDLGAEGVTIILGPNGSGKTTLLRVMHGVERISDGIVRWAVPESEAQHHQAYVFQTPIMLRRTVTENLAYPLRLIGMERREVTLRVEEWCSRIGLKSVANLSATRLSGGEKQKLALARALIRKPQVLFLDEPCANLDGASTRDIETLLAEAVSGGTRLIMTTHDMGQARRLATDIIFMLHGKVHESGPAQALLDAPQTPELQAFYRGDIIT